MTWCLLLTGMPNSGKSTLAYNLVQARLRNVLIIDGDKHREMQFLGEKLGFEKADFKNLGTRRSCGDDVTMQGLLFLITLLGGFSIFGLLLIKMAIGNS